MGGPLSALRCSLPFGFLRLSLFGHVIAPDVIQPSSEYSQQTKEASERYGDLNFCHRFGSAKLADF
jgi:hypothetical protein